MQDSLINPQERERLENIRKEKKELYHKIDLLNSELKDITNKLDILCIPRDDQDPVVFKKKNAIQMFKSNPKSAIDFLTVHGIIDGSPESVANIFIEENDHLCKTTIGDYIGEVSKEFNLEVLNHFVKNQNFVGSSFVSALRNFLTTFNLPGESQKIDKIIHAFADVYHEHNPGIFTKAEDAYVLSFAAIMLNTTLHNVNVKSQPNGLADEETFVKTMLNYDETTHLSEDIARATYHDIKEKPIRPNQGKQITLGSLQYGQSVMDGFLFKMSGPVKTWKKRWFVLTDTSLLCFINSEQRVNQSKGVISLDNAQVTVVTNDRSKEFAFNITLASHLTSTSSPPSSSPKHNSGSHDNSYNPSALRSDFVHSINSATISNPIFSHHSSQAPQLWRLAASSSEERDTWVQQVNSVIDSLRANRTCFELLSNGGSFDKISNQYQLVKSALPELINSVNGNEICPSAVNAGYLKNLSTTIVGLTDPLPRRNLNNNDIRRMNGD